MPVETVGTCAYCNASVKAWKGPHGPKVQQRATCEGCGRTWPRLKEWGGLPVAPRTEPVNRQLSLADLSKGA
jgi:hypothetical protein